MKEVPSYGKILTLGARYSENALVGEVVVQEKVDGSQFAFGVNEDGQVVMRSKGQALHFEAPEGMFAHAIRYVQTLIPKLKTFPGDTYFYCEYLQKPKHNTLCYEKTPLNHLVLFDVQMGSTFASREQLESVAALLEIDPIPELFRGTATVEDVKALMTTPSYLGKEILEGVVIKNYGQTILINGALCPLFTKYVREDFKERHATEWKTQSPKNSLALYFQGFKTEARWQKAVQHLRDAGTLLGSPRDIGALIKEVQRDITEEERETIKEELYKFFSADILRTSTQGLPEWYKSQLLNTLN